MNPFEKHLARARLQAERVNESGQAITYSVNSGDYNKAYEDAFQFAYDVERLTLMARQLPAYTGRPEARERMEIQIRRAMPITVGYTVTGWFGLRLPSLLPKKEKGSADYIRLSLYVALQDYFNQNERKRFRESVIVFRHRYDRRRPERWIRDHDNIEVNAVIDTLALFVLEDDTANLCDHYYCSVSGDCNQTEAYIIPRHEFPGWVTMIAYGDPGPLHLV